MTNEEYIKSLPTFDFAKFIHDVSCNSTKITTCEENCIECEYSDGWCISNIAEWLKEQNEK